MLKIEIKEPNLTGRKWQNGNPVFEQHAWAFIPEPNGNTADYPQRVTLRLEDNSQPYPIGVYVLPSSDFYVGNFGALTVGRAHLKPYPAAVQKAA